MAQQVEILDSLGTKGSRSNLGQQGLFEALRLIFQRGLSSRDSTERVQ